MFKEIENFISFVRIKYHTWWGMFAQFILTLIIYSFALNLFIQFFGIIAARLSFIAVNMVLFAIWAFFFRYYPKNPNGKIGVIIALYCEDDLESLGARNDFIDKLNCNLREDGLNQKIQVVKVPNHHCSTITSYERAKEINQKVKGHFFVFGKIVKRPDGEDKIFIEMNGLVTHAGIPLRVSQQIARDFSESLPREIEFNDAFRFKSLRLSADRVYLSAKYIIGIAALVSGDVLIASQLHEKILSDPLMEKEKDLPILTDIKHKVKGLLAEEYLVLAKVAIREGKTEEYEKYIKLSLSHGQNIYGQHLFQAIKIFGSTEDANAALKEIDKAKDLAGGRQEWRYSEAFLLYWLGRYEDAYKSSQKITERDFIGEDVTVEEVLLFNQRLLEKHPDKIQLFFWMGYIVYKKLGDIVKGLEFFEKFKNGAREDQSYLVDKSKVFIKEIETEMGLQK